MPGRRRIVKNGAPGHPEASGQAPTAPPAGGRPEAGPEILDAVRKAVADARSRLLRTANFLDATDRGLSASELHAVAADLQRLLDEVTPR